MMDTPPSGKTSDDLQEQPATAPSFEQTLGRLEEIVHFLEEGKIGLDEALGCYEEGVGLLRKAYDLLEKAERRILLLSGVDSDGNPLLKPMDDMASFSLDREVAGPAAVEQTSAKTGNRRSRRQGDVQ